ncbi:hypothetical protein [Mariniluteicoccus flavus]
MTAPRPLAALAVAVSLATALTACGKDPGTTPPPGPSSSAPAGAPGGPAQPSYDPTEAPTRPPEGTEFSFDQAARYDDGVLIEIGDIHATTATGTQHGAEGTSGQVVIAEIVVTNKSGAPFVTDTMKVWGYYAGVGAPKIVDSTGAVGDSFRGTVAPGGQAKAVMGFVMPHDQLGDITIEVDGGDDAHGPLQFTGTVPKR